MGFSRFQRLGITAVALALPLVVQAADPKINVHELATPPVLDGDGSDWADIPKRGKS